MINYLRKRPMIIAAVGCVLSAVCGFYFEDFPIFGLCAGIILFSLSLFFKRGKMAVVIFLILIMNINCLITIGNIKDIEGYVGKEITAKIIFTDTTYKGSDSFRSDCEVVDDAALPRGTRLSLWHKPADVEDDYIFKVKLKLKAIDKDFKAMSYGKGIYINGNIAEMEKTEEYEGVGRAVRGVRKYIKRSLFGGMDFDSASTMTAIVFGDNSYFSDEFYGNVKASGVAHVMVVSGMHLSILVSLVLWFGEKILYNSKIRALIMYLTVVLLSAVCGFTMSILRAGVTYIIMGIGLLLNRYNCPENSLGTAVTVISIFSPFAIFSVSFQLSVLSTFGILAVALPVCKYIDRKFGVKRRFIKTVTASAIVSLSAMLLTLPVVIRVFGYVSVVGVVTNLLISSVVTVLLSGCVIALIFGTVFPNFAKLFLNALDYGVRYVNHVINFMGSLPFAVVRVPEYFTYIAVLLNFCVFWLLLACKRRQDMIKLKEINQKVIRERGSIKKWQLFLKKP